MKILFLNYEFPPLGGGASPISFEIAQGYARQKHQVDVITMGFEDLPPFETREGINIWRIKSIRKKKEICTPPEMLHFVVAARKFLQKHLQTHQYDVCHCHFAIPTGILARFVYQHYKIPYIITSHGSDIPKYNNDRFTFLHLFTKPILKRVLAQSKGNFAGSNYLANLANTQLHPPIPYQVIREGFYAENITPAPKEKIILSSGRLLPRKGFQFLIQALREEKTAYQIHICGDGPMMPELQQLAQNSTTPVVFHGWLDNASDTYRQLLSKAAVYVLVSEKENASKALLEAMSAGCAVITSNVAGCPETVADAGITIAPDNTDLLRKTLLDLLNNPEKIADLGKKARARIVENYNWDKLIASYIAVLEKVKRS
ncbi:MAG: glycosyltransferase family 4 protein [Chitinophagales bacterium]|nr:glycosyltransferase family 4 protein [Chitinophagales bacterium]